MEVATAIKWRTVRTVLTAVMRRTLPEARAEAAMSPQARRTMVSVSNPDRVKTASGPIASREVG